MISGRYRISQHEVRRSSLWATNADDDRYLFGEILRTARMLLKALFACVKTAATTISETVPPIMPAFPLFITLEVP